MKSTKVYFRFCLIAIFLMSLAFSSASAQILTGKIAGTVLDKEGGPLPGVSVVLSSPKMMGTRAEVSTVKGTFRFVNLEPGVYKMVLTMEGFRTVERENIRVSVNSTVTVEVILEQQTLEKEVVVTGVAPVIDVTKSGVSTTFNRDNIENIPTGRGEFYDIIKMAPGINASGETSSRFESFGSNAQSNAFYVDGVNMSSHELGIAWTWIHQDALAEIETAGIGAPAEYGKFTGAVVNIITKSGGNRLEGSLGYYGQFDALTDDNNPDPANYFSFKRHKYNDLQLSIGGPLIKDKLWFFATGDLKSNVYTDWQSDPAYPGIDKLNQVFAKLTFQISPKHKLTGTFNYPYSIGGPSPTPTYLKEATTGEEDFGPITNFNYSWLISNTSYLELKYGYWFNNDDAVANYGGDFNKRCHIDFYTGVVSNAPDYSVWWDIIKHDAKASYSHFADDFLGASHDLKVGVQYTHSYLHGYGGYSGGGRYYDYDNQPYLLYERQQWQYGGEIDSLGVFADDSIQIGSRLTLNLGIRADYQNANYPAFPKMSGWTVLNEKAPGIDNLITWKTFLPRFGFAYSLTSDKKTVLRASFGRYYDSLLAAQFDWPGPGATDLYKYSWNGAQWELYDLVPGSMGYTIDPNLKNPYSDQFSIGIERELLANFSLGALFIYKNEKNLLGQQDVGATYEAVQRTSPDNGKTYTVYNQISPPESNLYQWTNPPGYDLTYRAVILSASKRFSHNWLMNASLTWSRSEGLICTANRMGSSAQMAMGWYAGLFGQDPTDLVNARGRLQNDRPWVFKLQLGYVLPWDIMLSANYLYQTGAPYNTFVRVFDLNQSPYRPVFVEPRGNKRFEDWNKLDFRVQKTFTFASRFKIRALVDIFNAFNSKTILGYQTYNLWSSAFGQGSQMFQPRRAQLALILEF